jgi:hypothetical protein
MHKGTRRRQRQEEEKMEGRLATDKKRMDAREDGWMERM